MANLGMYLSVDSLEPQTLVSGDSVRYWPQLMRDTTSILSDTMNWTPVKGYFKAKGGERFVYVGNFFPDNRINVVSTSLANAAYYFIDDVGVYKNECPTGLDSPDVKPEQSFTLYPNPGNANFACGYPLRDSAVATIEVYDVPGRLVLNLTTRASVTTVDTANLSAGLYIVRMSVNGSGVGQSKWVKAKP